ncbi:hypothetical protein WA026_016290 [Henosepilachna vigintioctopunctata]|uniref:trypsin n=1 Tax=Henosepilachna vigintioctopunctata TaxID=420089 RepID=A0AAW1UJX6_9CUCU
MLYQSSFLSFVFVIFESRNVLMHDRIVGGRTCTVEEFPFVVSIRRHFNLQHICTGSLIDPEWILSAAHCLFKTDPSEMVFLVGHSNIQPDLLQVMKAKKIYFPKDYKLYIRDDIVLVHLEHKVKMFPGVVDTIQLPPSNLTDDLSEFCESHLTAIGWGSTKPWSETKPKYEASPQLKCVDLRYITNMECIKFAFSAMNTNLICTLVADDGVSDTCQGDSGAPVFCNYKQYGIVSFGNGCGQKDRPKLNTRVDRYLDFITSTMKNTSTDHSILWPFLILQNIFLLSLV